MKYIDTEFSGLKIIEPQVFGDERGYFMETFRDDKFKETCAKCTFIQENHSKSTLGVLRGLHYQIQNTQGKLVRVTRGCVYDVVVDLRQSSSTFGEWFGLELSESNKLQLWVPEGFAHGFYVMSESAELVYKSTNYYSPEHERTLIWDDAKLAIKWPLVREQAPFLSAKDRAGVDWDNAEFFP